MFFGLKIINIVYLAKNHANKMYCNTQYRRKKFLFQVSEVETLEKSKCVILKY